MVSAMAKLGRRQVFLAVSGALLVAGGVAGVVRTRGYEVPDRELASLAPEVPVWFCVTPAPAGTHTRTGEPLAEVTHAVAGLPAAFAVGVNCCPPGDVSPALQRLDPAASGLCGVAYPNSGELWDAAARRWRGAASWPTGAVEQWHAAGARLVGGCCRVFPEQIAAVAGRPPTG